MQHFRDSKLSGILALVLFVVFLFEGCVQVSRIKTNPKGARISINGAPIGESPVYYNTRSGIPKTYFLEVEKPGYKTFETKLESSYRADISLLLLLPGIIPYFFSARIEDEYKFILIKK